MNDPIKPQSNDQQVQLPTQPMPPQSLRNKYLTPEDRNPRSAKSKKEGGSQGIMAILGGVACIVAGIALSTRDATKQVAYYGLVMVGTALVIEGIYCISTKKSYQFMPKWVHVISWIIGFIVGMIFLVIMLGK